MISGRARSSEAPEAARLRRSRDARGFEVPDNSRRPGLRDARDAETPETPGTPETPRRPRRPRRRDARDSETPETPRRRRRRHARVCEMPGTARRPRLRDAPNCHTLQSAAAADIKTHDGPHDYNLTLNHTPPHISIAPHLQPHTITHSTTTL